MEGTGIRIVLADDDTLLREGIASLLERSGFTVAGQAGDARELLALVNKHRPDLAIVDIRMPPGPTAGLDAALVIHSELPGTAVLLLSAHAEPEQALDVLSAGHGVGYLLKSRVTDMDEFTETVQRVARGGSAVDPALVGELITARRPDDDPLADLTEREREVLALMAEGRSNAGIAQRLWITEGTVEKHVRSIMYRLRLPETTEDHRRVLAVLAYLDSQ